MADDYIKRDDAVKALADMLAFEAEMDYCDTFTSDDFIDDAKGYFQDVPSADVAPVVRCKDCRYYQDNNDGYPHDGCRWRSDETPDADDFCSMGERKDND